jgi:predicted branched-subunit amino acid permease
MTSARRDFLDGVRDIAPVAVGNVPFGMVVGAATVAAGFSGLQALAFAAVGFVAAAQLAAIDLLGRGAPLVVVVVTALVLNLRFLIYSASLGPYFLRESRPWKLVLAFLITDPGYALSITRFEREPETSRRWYYVGAALPLWTIFVAGNVAGIALGDRIPSGLDFAFILPLIFLGLLVPALDDRPSVAAGVVGGGVAVLGAGLPLNLGLFVGAITGVVVGATTHGRWS